MIQLTHESKLLWPLKLYLGLIKIRRFMVMSRDGILSLIFALKYRGIGKGKKQIFYIFFQSVLTEA
jgi:hypothetical protein